MIGCDRRGDEGPDEGPDPEDIEDPSEITFDVVEAMRWLYRHSAHVNFEQVNPNLSTVEVLLPLRTDGALKIIRSTDHQDAPYVVREMCEQLRQWTGRE